MGEFMGFEDSTPLTAGSSVQNAEYTQMSREFTLT